MSFSPKSPNKPAKYNIHKNIIYSEEPGNGHFEFKRPLNVDSGRIASSTDFNDFDFLVAMNGFHSFDQS